MSTVSPPKGSIFTPNSASRSRLLQSRGRFGRAQIDRLGHQQALRFDRAGRHALPQVLVENALVQGVLVDDRHALVGFGHEVAVVDLQGGGCDAVAAVGMRIAAVRLPADMQRPAASRPSGGSVAAWKRCRRFGRSPTARRVDCGG